MTDEEQAGGGLAADEVLVYVGGQPPVIGQRPGEEPVGIRSALQRAKNDGLAVVKIDDAELDRLRAQVSRIATRLESGGPPQAASFGVESITLHIGLSASGHFFLVAGAAVEAAVDITWSRRG